MLSPTLIRIGVTAALGLHAVAHANALAALVRQALGQTPDLAARLWPLPNLGAGVAAGLGLPLWIIATAAFALAALSFWGVALPLPGWRQLAIGGAVASVLGVALFFGTWPGAPDTFYSLLDIGVALAMNFVIFGVLLWLHWPPEPMFGR
jgi:hypothetical protein